MVELSEDRRKSIGWLVADLLHTPIIELSDEIIQALLDNPFAYIQTRNETKELPYWRLVKNPNAYISVYVSNNKEIVYEEIIRKLLWGCWKLLCYSTFT